jgi:hypothetical protein
MFNQCVGFERTADMVIKIIFAAIAFFAVSFLTRFLVALLKESALANRRKGARQPAAGSQRKLKVRMRKLSRLEIVEGNEIRRILTL